MTLATLTPARLIAPDANLLIYAYSRASPFHPQSRIWLEELLSSSQHVGIPIHSVYAFLRVMTHSRLSGGAVSMTQAIATIDTWLAVSNVRILYPGNRHWGLLKSIAKESSLGSGHITDAAIAAIALEYGATVHTNDRDFARFPDVRWHNPLKL